MSKWFSLALGILAAIGGFVDIGDLVFNSAAGATFGYQLLWVIPVGVVGIIVYSEMCGRVAAVSGKAVFDAVRERTGFSAGLVALVSSELVNLLTLAAEVGASRSRCSFFRAAVPLLIVFAIGRAGGHDLGRSSSTGSRRSSATAASACSYSPSRRSGSPRLGQGREADSFRICAEQPCAVRVFRRRSARPAMTPYEVYFYSSGGIEDHWSTKDLGLNRANAIAGYSLGGFLSLSLMIVGAAVFLRHGISPEHLGTVALGSEEPLGKIGLLLALVGILFAVGGASIDTVFAGAYNLAQFFGWEWGRYRHPPVRHGSRSPG